MTPVRYNKAMINEIDGILKASAEVIEHVKAAMAESRVTHQTIEHLLALREDLAVQLSQYDRGVYVPDDMREQLHDHEHEATDMLLDLQLDHQSWESPAIRRARDRTLSARLRILESADSPGP